MTPNAEVFERLLPRLQNVTVVPWLEPSMEESIPRYCERLAQTLDEREPVIICGVSFGGIVAFELAKRLNTRACVLVSSIRHPRELPPWFLVFWFLSGSWCAPFLSTIGALAAAFPHRIRTNATARLTKLSGVSGRWHRWATAAVLRWAPSPSRRSFPVVQIHGDRDATFPIRYLKPDVVIPGGDHVIPLTHDREIAAVLTEIAARDSQADSVS